MRKCLRTSVLAAACTLVAEQAAAQASSPPAIGVVGQNVEMYTVGSCTVNGCPISFAQNTTGKIIKIDYVSCKITIDGYDLLEVGLGPTATPNNGNFLKVTYLGEWNRVTFSTSRYYYVSASPGIFLGPGRYLTVFPLAASGTPIVRCQASGEFAQ